MNIPSDPVVWIVLIVGVALVVALIVRKGGGLKVSHGDISVELIPPEQDKEGDISVLNEASVDNSEIGNITGSNNADSPAGRNIKVANNSTFTKSKVGNITGIEGDDKP